MEKPFFGLVEAAKLIGVSPGSLRYHLLFGRAGDISLRAPNGSRLFTPGDVQRLRTLLNPDRRNQSREGASHV
jgi:DNA-binding transcriptional MerR regulator